MSAPHRLWHWLTEASEGVQDEELRRRTHHLLALLVFIAVLCCLVGVSLPFQLMVVTDRVERLHLTRLYPILLAVMGVLLVVSHLLARDGRYRLAARVLIASACTIFFGDITAASDSRMILFPMSAVVLTGVVLSPWDTVGALLVIVAGYLAVPLVVASITIAELIPVILVATIVGAISTAAAVLRDQDHERIRRQAAELRANQERLVEARKMEAVARLSGGIAHEFNNIYMGISGYAEIIATSSKGVAADYARRIRESGKRVSRLTEQLLSFSGQRRLHPVAIDIDVRFKQDKESLSLMFRPDARLTLLPSAGTKIVFVDGELFFAAIQTLVRKAADSAPAGGTISIETMSQKLAESNVHNLPAGEYCDIVISAQSRIPNVEATGQMFEPFYTSGEFGTGDLDLAAAYGLIRQSGGQLEVEAGAGGVRNFVVYVPLHAGGAQRRVGGDLRGSRGAD